MNWGRIEGSWTEWKGKVKEKWGQLTDDALEQAAGRRDQLVGALQRRYGYERDRAERELDELTRTRPPRGGETLPGPCGTIGGALSPSVDPPRRISRIGSSKPPMAAGDLDNMRLFRLNEFAFQVFGP
jgi:uncharacterized protein YjbJ (UPF0337 family)